MTNLIIVLAMILLLFLAFRMSLFLARRAVCTVISLFRQKNAVQPQNSRTLAELGFDTGFRLHFLRDYRPWAFQTLFQAGVIRSVLDGMYYLAEEKLDTLNVKCPVSRQSWLGSSHR